MNATDNKAKLEAERRRAAAIDEKLKVWSHVIERLQKMEPRDRTSTLAGIAIFFGIERDVIDSLVKGGR